MLYPLSTSAAEPLLPLVLARISRTPKARLAIGYILVGQRAGRCGGTPAHRAAKQAARNEPQAARQMRLASGQRFPAASRAALDVLRGVGGALATERVLTGGIVGSRLNLLGRETDPRLCAEPAPGAGTALDILV